MSKHFTHTLLLAGAALSLALLTGCAAQVPVQAPNASTQVKSFEDPAPGKAGIYIYREDNLILGAGLYKDLYVDGVCLGETAPGVFFYTEVEGGKEHTFATESEFGTNELKVFTEAGKNYFFEQFVTWGVFVYGADIRQVTEAEGKQMVQSYQQAIPGTCSNQ